MYRFCRSFVLLATFINAFCIDVQAAEVRDGFESPELSSLWTDMRIDASDYRFVAEPVREGRQALEITLQPGTKSEVGKGGTLTERAELTDADHLRSSMGEEAWYAFSFYIPEDVTIPEGRIVFAQWKQACADCTLKHHPIVSLRLRSGTLRVYVQDDAQKMVLYKKSHSLQGRWTDVVFGLKPRLDDDGMLQVFINKEQVVAYDGPFGYADDKPEVYFKMGLYRDANPHPMRIIIDDYRRGTSRDEITVQHKQDRP